MDISLPIIEKTYQSYKKVVDIVNHCEKRWRYSLGVSTETNMLMLLENLISAKNAPRSMKNAYLIKANTQLEVAMLKLRLFLELKIANETKIFQTQSILREIGRMLGGWKKSMNF